VNPRVLFVGRGRLTLPLRPWLGKKWDAMSEVLDLHVLNAGEGTGDDRFTMLSDGAAAFYSRLPLDVARAIRSFRPQVVIASDPYLGVAVRAGRRLARSDARVVVEVHGDPRTLTRGYGSQFRRALSPIADAAARSGIEKADATRALSRFTSSIIEEIRGIPATAAFPTYSDLEAFADPPVVPVPEAQRIVFVGALETYKNVDGLVASWRRLQSRLPRAELTVIGRGSRHAVIDELVRELPETVKHHPVLEPPDVATAIDRSRALVLPSWPEGLGRVVLEAFARARTVVATDAGGIPDMVTNGKDGILVPLDDVDALVDGMAAVLEDRDLAVRLGEAGRDAYRPWHQTPADFAAAYRDLVDRVLAGAR
jgi:glycosyltransferase involved in cell wall biosynthesis